MTHQISSVLVYGATGAQARPVARRLIEAGVKVRVLSRSAEKAGDLVALGAELAIGDLSDAASLHAASQGMDGVFLLIPFFDPKREYAENAIEAAREAGVRLLVWNATGKVAPVRVGNPGMDVRLDILERLQASGIPHILLEPTVYMENLLGPWTAPEVAAANTLAYPIPNAVKLQWVSHEDVAAFAVAAFQRPELANARYEVCGPEILDGEAMAARFSAALGRPIAFRPMPPAEFGAIIDKAFGGGGASAAAAYEAVYENPALLSTSIDTESLLRALSITPTALEDWARGYAPAFTPR